MLLSKPGTLQQCVASKVDIATGTAQGDVSLDMGKKATLSTLPLDGFLSVELANDVSFVTTKIDFGKTHNLLPFC
jgi:hypothetical protein